MQGVRATSRCDTPGVSSAFAVAADAGSMNVAGSVIA